MKPFFLQIMRLRLRSHQALKKKKKKKKKRKKAHWKKKRTGK